MGSEKSIKTFLTLPPLPKTTSHDVNTNWLMHPLEKNYAVGPGLGFQHGENSHRCLSCLTAAEGPLFSPRETHYFTQRLLTICWATKSSSAIWISPYNNHWAFNRTDVEWYDSRCSLHSPDKSCFSCDPCCSLHAYFYTILCIWAYKQTLPKLNNY